MNFKPSITVGWDAEGKPHLLYLGHDPDHALKACENPPDGIILAQAYRKPDAWKKRKFELPAVAEVVEQEVTAETLSSPSQEAGSISAPLNEAELTTTEAQSAQSSETAPETAVVEPAPVVEPVVEPVKAAKKKK